MINWTADDMPDLKGKTVVVTGANSGLGFEATKKFAQKQAQVVMACRSIERGKNAKQDIEAEFEDADLQVKKMDLASLQSVRDFAEEFKANNEELDILCNNAGIMAIPREETEDGFEKQFGVNHLGHFALTAQLIPALEEANEARIVNQSSALHERGELNFDDLMHEESYEPMKVYGDSKLANVLFTYELDRKLSDTDIEALACHPGYAATNLQSRGPEKEGSTLKKYMMKAANKVLAQSAEKGTLPMLYAATSERAKSGDYIGPNGFKNMRGYPEKQESSEESYDEGTAEKLWRVSEELTGIDFEI
ncbi:MAG: NAD(P)-dependent dehydrogenase (short-subunit alcohol dehydrogenase family) [Candidatus Nanohaloarchaea archaeon]|jgi:NAD(P)-dependent dehydrogenase (short-subunit alcohol dehydrogenase family)